jgi:hypothetical protein
MPALSTEQFICFASGGGIVSAYGNYDLSCVPHILFEACFHIGKDFEKIYDRESNSRSIIHAPQEQSISDERTRLYS